MTQDPRGNGSKPATGSGPVCLMLVDAPVESDRRVVACIRAYREIGCAVEVVNVKATQISRGDWLRAAPHIAWFVVYFTLIWLWTAATRFGRYRYLWRAKDLARYRLRRLNLPEIFWYETYVHLARGVAFARAAREVWDRASMVHAHDLAALSFAQYAATWRRLPLTYDAHELSAFRNRPSQSWLSGLAITAFEAAGIRRSADHVISVSPFIAAYMRFFAARSAARYHLVVNDFYAEAPIAPDPDAPAESFAIVYIGSIIRGRGLKRMVEAFQHAPGARVFLYSPEDNPRQRGFGEAYKPFGNVVVRYGPYDETVRRDLAPFARAYGWLGLEDVCLSYRYAVPNKVFQYLKFAIDPIADSRIYALDFLARYAKRKAAGGVAPADRTPQVRLNGAVYHTDPDVASRRTTISPRYAYPATIARTRNRSP